MLDTIGLDFPPNTYQYFINLPPVDEYSALQRKEITSTGSQSEIAFAYSVNFNNKLYVGGTVSLNNLSYNQESIYTETYPETDTLNSMRLVEEFRNDGQALSARLGFIYKVTDFTRVGFAAHTPINYSITEQFQHAMTANFRGNVGTQFQSTVPIENSYRIRTPWRIQVSAAHILRRKIALTGQYEWIDYRQMRLDGDEIDFSAQNSEIRDVLRNVHNISFGAEYRYTNYYFRGGFRYEGSPFESEFQDFQSNRQTYSLGIGYKKQRFFADVAWMVTTFENELFLYDPIFSPVASTSINQHRISASIGFRWF